MRGQELMDEVCRQLDLVEKDYFGLRFVDTEKQRVCHTHIRMMEPAIVLTDRSHRL